MDAGLVQIVAGQLLQPLLGLAAAGVTYLCARAVRWLDARAKNEAASAALDRLNDAVAASVGEIEQSIVKAFKAASPDGKLTADMARVVKQAAIDSVKTHLGAAGVQRVQKSLGVQDMDVVIASRVEAAVGQKT